MRTLLIFILTIPYVALSQSTLEKSKNLLQNKNQQEATKLLKSISKSDKDFAQAQFYLGRIAFDQKKLDDAADYFETATELEKKMQNIFSGLAIPMVALHAMPMLYARDFWLPK
jgi:tetratricopeptide (TPR) repeat protein